MCAVMEFAVGFGPFWLIQRRKVMKQRRRNFKRNGGLLLQQQLSSSDGVVENTRIFSARELKKATGHFSENRIIGHGGNGTVFKGVLADGKVVAVKRSKNIDDSRLGQFINEVVILSQINHRNVVKLLGCCLETDVPLLVYEFISNGTLAQHIHSSRDEFLHLSWSTRLRIAAETAGAIAYLHSSSSNPIYHRDIKSSNILLDYKYKAKVADFGISRAIVIDQTHLTTQVQGTFGYLDPEYYHSGQFTDKSDVYSFGVVLVELLTSKKPISADQSNDRRSLVAEFRSAFENSCSLDILDPVVSREAEDEEIKAVVKLSRECLNVNGRNRPTMKEVAMVLEVLISRRETTSKQRIPPEWFPGAAYTSEVDAGNFTSSTFSSYYDSSCSLIA